ncbi:MAG: hypothetical protein WA989_14710 [Henriciella sp.]|uniref:hypothetical protein n=1 Tax=Henriciella sp. TaxID=1968823 RepID=UPI003C76ECEE
MSSPTSAHILCHTHAMQDFFIMLMIVGSLGGLAIGVLSHPKFYAAIFRKKKAGSADHEHSLD